MRRTSAEALGTFALVAIGPGAAMVAARTHAFGHTGIALAFGLAVTLIVASSGHLGGAHVNPAVTIGFWSVRRLPGRDVAPYVLAQCVGAIAASALLGWLLGPVGDFGATVPGLPLAQSFVVEMDYTGFLGFVIMGVATDERTPAAVAPFAIGVTVFAGALVTGPLTGGSFNPARTLGPAVMASIWTGHWLYWAAPILGAVLGMRLYDALRTPVASATPPIPTGTEGLSAAARERSSRCHRVEAASGLGSLEDHRFVAIARQPRVTDLTTEESQCPATNQHLRWDAVDEYDACHERDATDRPKRKR